ncbi:MAG: hypothetical protein JJE36_06940 [Coriobacteriia bacterium]|nr:hypothetical protein [Coriobacteriia bacterium]
MSEGRDPDNHMFTLQNTALVANMNFEELVADVRKLMDDDELRDGYACRLYNYVKETYSIPEMVEKYTQEIAGFFK